MMTGLSGNRLSICPLTFRIASPKIAFDLSCASVSRNSWGGDAESLEANRSAFYPRDHSLFVYYYTMNFMQEQGLAKRRSHAHAQIVRSIKVCLVSTQCSYM